MIFVECYADETLMKSLGIAGRDITHAYSKGNVCNRLQKTSGSKGLVDEDPASGQPNYLRGLRLISDTYDIKYYRDTKHTNHLIILCPDLETWIINAARKENLDLTQYDLPDNSNELHKIINCELLKFEDLLAALQKLPSLQHLKRLSS